MDRKVILIVGLPASGKSCAAINLYKFFASVPGIRTILIDDPEDWKTDVLVKIYEEQPELVILTDPYLCVPKHRDIAETRLGSLGFGVEWIFFDNDPEACLANAKRRPGKRVETDIRWFSKQYKIPKGMEVRPVWKETT